MINSRTKKYPNAFFTRDTLVEAFDCLVPRERRKIDHAKVKSGQVTVQYNSESEFLAKYQPDVESATLAVRTDKWFAEVRWDGCDSEISAVAPPDTRQVEAFFAVFDNSKPLARAVPKPIAFERFCEVGPLNWEVLPMLADRLRQLGFEVKSETVTLSRYPDATTYSEWAPTLADVREKGEPKRYTIQLVAAGPVGSAFITIQRERYLDSRESYLRVDFTGLHSIGVAEDVIAFLGLQSDVPPKGTRLERSAFIAHRFDAEGEQAADRLARFLEMLAFDVQTGRGFSAGSVSEKVRKRIESQAIIFILLTPTEDTTWLTQESVLAYAKGKPIFVLRDMRAQFTPGVFGDLEYIVFNSPAIEGAFIAILEGLRELGYMSFL